MFFARREEGGGWLHGLLCLSLTLTLTLGGGGGGGGTLQQGEGG
jgi:hypothetical protein